VAPAPADSGDAAHPGFEPAVIARPPLVATDGAARYELWALVSHIGAGAHSGHYIAHVRHPAAQDKWIIFNDEKVAESQKPPLQLATLYFYRRVAA
jgi:ubiquitin carboxyl-terminal hydrolase 5/13